MSSLDFSVVLQAAPYLWSGLQFSLALTASAFCIAMVLGTVFAVVQQLEIPVLSQFVRSYIALIRSIPLILVLFWFFFLVPNVLALLSRSGQPIPLGPTATAFITYGLFEAAYYAEIIRVGLRSVSKGQYEASASLGISTFHMYRRVVLPQAFRISMPIILSQTIILFQDTSLVYVLSLTDLVGAASKMAQLNGRLVEMYLAVALIYLIICSVTSQGVAVLRRRYSSYESRH